MGCKKMRKSEVKERELRGEGAEANEKKETYDGDDESNQACDER